MQHGTLRTVCGVALILLGLTVTVVPTAAQNSYQTIDYPGVAGQPGVTGQLGANGINDLQNVVGGYTQPGAYHGYLFSRGTFSTIDYPISGVSETVPYGINYQGQIVGYYLLNQVIHGFLLTAGSYSTIDFPGANWTTVTGINSAGKLSGWYTASGNHGFVGFPGGLSTYDFPGATATFVLGINDFGDIAGSWTLNNNLHGFVVRGGNATSIDFPGALATRAFAINEGGLIVGSYLDNTNNPRDHGFLFAGGKFSTIDPPGSTFTICQGIGNSGQIVGYYVDSLGASHGFKALVMPLLDPVPYALNGPNVVSATAPPNQSGLNGADQLLSGRPVVGVAADGVSQVVIAIPATNVGDAFTLTLFNDQSVQSSSPSQDGGLGQAGNSAISSSQVTVTAVATTSNGPYAFAVYRAPSDFAPGYKYWRLSGGILQRFNKHRRSARLQECDDPGRSIYQRHKLFDSGPDCASPRVADSRHMV